LAALLHFHPRKHELDLELNSLGFVLSQGKGDTNWLMPLVLFRDDKVQILVRGDEKPVREEALDGLEDRITWLLSKRMDLEQPFEIV
jgi:hypothetical protein